MKRWRRAALVLGTAFLLATPVAPGPERPAPGPAVSTLVATPVLLDSREPERRRLGPLLFLEGWSLSAEDRRFGSISAMHVAGDRVVAASDAGMILTFPVPRGAEWESEAHVMPLVPGPGSPTRKVDRDVESMAVIGGTAWLGFENLNAVWRYRLADWQPVSGTAPPAMEDWGFNQGAEAMLALDEGRFLVFAESRGEDGLSEALLFDGDPSLRGTRAERLHFRPPEGYRITDAARLPDGRLLLLTRRFTFRGGFSSKLVVADPAQVRAGGRIEGEEVATFADPLIHDNLEALSVTQENGRTILWIASDDNFSPFQRTLLLKFAWLG